MLDAVLVAEDLQHRTVVHCADRDLWDSVHPMVYDQLSRAQYGRPLDALLIKNRVYFVADDGPTALYCDCRHRVYRLLLHPSDDGAVAQPTHLGCSLALFEWTIPRATRPPPGGLAPVFQQVLPSEDTWLVLDALKILSGGASLFRKGLFLYRGCHGMDESCTTLLYASPSHFVVVVVLVVGSETMETMPLASRQRSAIEPAILPCPGALPP